MRSSPGGSCPARLFSPRCLPPCSSALLLTFVLTLLVPALPASGQDVTLELGTQNNERVIVKQKDLIIRPCQPEDVSD